MVVRSPRRAMMLLALGTLVVPLLNCSAPVGQNVAGASSTLVNPLLGNTVAITAGCELYGAHCAHCHGDAGHGNGEHGLGLVPPPANLVTPEELAKPDGHLFQRVWFGGLAPPYNSNMPAFSEIMTHDQVWQVLAYVRALAAGSVKACADSETEHEHSHGPSVVAGSAAPPAAGTAALSAAGAPALSTAAAAGTAGVAAPPGTGGQIAAGSAAGAPIAGIGGAAHAGEGGAHDH